MKRHLNRKSTHRERQEKVRESLLLSSGIDRFIYVGSNRDYSIKERHKDGVEKRVAWFWKQDKRQPKKGPRS